MSQTRAAPPACATFARPRRHLRFCAVPRPGPHPAMPGRRPLLRAAAGPRCRVLPTRRPLSWRAGAGVLTQADQQQRFDTLQLADPDAARRQLDRLAPGARALAAAQLAFHRRDPDALSTLAAVPAVSRDDPALLLAEARYLRRAGADQPALAVWRSLAGAEAAMKPERRAPFWAERDALARRLLSSGDDADAYFLADDRGLPAEQALDADFLAGWIALRRLHEPVPRAPAFLGIGQRRACRHHQGARLLLAGPRPDRSGCRADHQGARRGLAHHLLRPDCCPGGGPGGRCGPAADCRPDRSSRRCSGTRAAGRYGAGARRRHPGVVAGSAAAPPISCISCSCPAPQRPNARRWPASRCNRACRMWRCRRPGWPGATGRCWRSRAGPPRCSPPAGQVAPSLTLAIMRQESSFDPGAVSAAGAQGLMQLMSATAAQIGRALHMPAAPLTDPATNMRLGTAYLGTLLAQFGGNPGLCRCRLQCRPAPGARMDCRKRRCGFGRRRCDDRLGSS